MNSTSKEEGEETAYEMRKLQYSGKIEEQEEFGAEVNEKKAEDVQEEKPKRPDLPEPMAEYKLLLQETPEAIYGLQKAKMAQRINEARSNDEIQEKEDKVDDKNQKNGEKSEENEKKEKKSKKKKD